MAKKRPATRVPAAPAELPVDAAPDASCPEDAHGPAESAFADQRTVEPGAVPAVELLRTVVTLQCVNLDAGNSGEAIPVSAVMRPNGIELTICHSGRLEIALPQAALSQLVSEANNPVVSLGEYRELVWLMGPAREPRSAIVGRALHDKSAFRPENAQTNQQICIRIQECGPHHLREEVRNALAAAENPGNSSSATRNLASLLGPAINYLGERGWVTLRAVSRGGGAYLQGPGIELFNGFPAWDRLDEEPPKLARPSGRNTPMTGNTSPGSSSPESTE